MTIAHASRGGLHVNALYALLIGQLLLFAALLTPLLLTPLANIAAWFTVDAAAELAVLNVVLGLAVTWWITRSLWDPRLLIYFSLLMFNAGSLIGHVLSPERPVVTRPFSDLQINSATYFVTICMAAWTLATVLSQFAQQAGIAAKAVEVPKAKIRFVGIFFLALGTVPALLELLDAVRAVASGGYFALYEQDVVVGAANWRAVAGLFFVPGLVWLLGSGTLEKRGRRWLLLSAMLYVVVQFLLGHRSAALLPLIAVLFTWHYQVQRIPRKLVIIPGLVLALVILPAIATLRQSDSVVNLSPTAVVQAVTSSDSPFLATLFETGNSILPTIYAIGFIPEARAYDHGSYYARSLWSILPSFGGLNLALQGGTYGQWLVQNLDPVIASLGGGLGYSPIAEAYANFGVIGGVFGFLALALVIQLGLARFSNFGNPLHVILTGVALTTLLFWPRSETLTIIRPIFWFAVFPALWVITSTRRIARRG